MHLHLHAGREAQHVHRGGREVDRQPYQVGDGLVLFSTQSMEKTYNTYDCTLLYINHTMVFNTHQNES